MRNTLIDQPFLLAQTAPATTGTTTAPSTTGAPAGSAPADNPLGGILPMILIFVAFWFLIFAPQRKRDKEHAKLLGELKAGDSVITSSGIYAKVEVVKDDRFILKISENGTRIEVAKSHVVNRVDVKPA